MPQNPVWDETVETEVKELVVQHSISMAFKAVSSLLSVIIQPPPLGATTLKIIIQDKLIINDWLHALHMIGYYRGPVKEV